MLPADIYTHFPQKITALYLRHKKQIKTIEHATAPHRTPYRKNNNSNNIKSFLFSNITIRKRVMISFRMRSFRLDVQRFQIASAAMTQH